MTAEPFITSGEIERFALFSEDKRYRYVLRRRFRGTHRLLRLCVWMNPSVADDKDDDPTIRVALGYAKRWQDGGIVVINVFDHVETKSRKLPKDPAARLGPEHWPLIDQAIRGEFGHVKREVFCGWGDEAHGPYAMQLLERLRSSGLTPAALQLTKRGAPSHPLRKSYALPLRPWDPEGNLLL
jgi:hypothetical protein